MFEKINALYYFISGLNGFKMVKKMMRTIQVLVVPQTSNIDDYIEKVGIMISSDRRLTLRLITDTLVIDKECVTQILNENAKMRKFA